MKEILAAIADWKPDGAFEWKLLANDVLGGLVAVASRKGHSWSDQSEQDDAKAPNVTLEVAGLVLDNFGCHEANGSSHLLDALVFAKFAGQAEVANFYFRRIALITQENVQVLKVAMDDAVIVHLLDTESDLNNESLGALLG